MTLPLDGQARTRLTLPPAFTGLVSTDREASFAQACRLAGRDGAGTLIVVERPDLVDFAVVLAPDEKLESARRAHLAAMAALADAVGIHAAPEMPIAIDWPGTLVFDGARLGGGRLGWPHDCGEAEVPDWLVYSATLLVSKPGTDEPGLSPDSTSLEEQGFSPDVSGAIIESFARILMKSFEVWEEDGFEPIALRYLARLRHDGAGPRRIEANGDAVIGNEVLKLRPELQEPAWRDPVTGRIRL